MEEEVALPCASKLAFDTEKQADAAALTAQWQHGSQVKSYKCRYCHLWHLASK